VDFSLTASLGGNVKTRIALLLFLALTLTVVDASAQDPSDKSSDWPGKLSSVTYDLSFGKTGMHGADQKNFGWFFVYQAGIAKKLSTAPQEEQHGSLEPNYHHWSVYLGSDFLYGGPRFKGSLAATQNMNPQTPVLLSATGGNGGFYSVTAGPRVQLLLPLPKVVVHLYGRAEGGWLRRSLDLTGPITEGSALQPNNPSVYRQASNSGALRISGGLAVGKKHAVFADFGVVRGFAINHGSILWPMFSAGFRF
jgi:hypothetical protein